MAAMHRSWRARRALDSAPPVLVVGSLRAGGSGKSPALLWIASRRPDLAILLHPTPDEQPQLAGRFPGRVFATRDLLEGWRRAREAGFQAAVCDGGFQDPAFDNAPSLVFWDGWPRQADLLPFGVFRETGEAMERAGAVLAESRVDAPDDLRPWQSDFAALRHTRPVFRYSWAFGPAYAVGVGGTPTASFAGGSGEAGEEVATPARRGGCPLLVAGCRVLVASGVARPGRWERDVAQAGFRIVASLRTRDHGRLDPRRIRRLSALHPGVPWLITEKDVPRWPTGCLPPEVAAHALPRRFRPHDPRGLLRWIDERIPAAGRST